MADASGTVVNHLRVGAFGTVVSQTNSSAASRFVYTGRDYDPETGLHQYRRRYYDADVGRFLSEDPTGFGAGDANLYRYVRNRVPNASDPTGLALASPLASFRGSNDTFRDFFARNVSPLDLRSQSSGDDGFGWGSSTTFSSPYSPSTYGEGLVDPPDWGTMTDSVNSGWFSGQSLSTQTVSLGLPTRSDAINWLRRNEATTQQLLEAVSFIEAFIDENQQEMHALRPLLSHIVIPVVKGELSINAWAHKVAIDALQSDWEQVGKDTGAFAFAALAESSPVNMLVLKEQLETQYLGSYTERASASLPRELQIMTREVAASSIVDRPAQWLQTSLRSQAVEWDPQSAQHGHNSAFVIEMFITTALDAPALLGGAAKIGILEARLAGREMAGGLGGAEGRAALRGVEDLAPAAEIDFAPRVLNRGANPVQPRNVPYLHRTPDLPETISLQELHRTRGIPGAQGVDLAPGSIDLQVYRRMWELSDHHGIEYSLARVRRADGTEVWRMYSGSSGSVRYNVQSGEQIVRYGGHTHPGRSPDPSYFFNEDMGRMAGDVETLNRLWEGMGYQGRMPHSRVIYGPNRVDTTRYFPNEGR